MRYKFLIIVLVVSIFSSINCASPYNYIEFSLNDFEKKVLGLKDTKNVLFVKAMSWMISTFRNPSVVIKYKDKEEGVIIGKYQVNMFDKFLVNILGKSQDLSFPLIGSMDVFMKVTVKVRDYKAHIELYPTSTFVALFNQQEVLYNIRQKIRSSKRLNFSIDVEKLLTKKNLSQLVKQNIETEMKALIGSFDSTMRVVSSF